MDPVPLSVEMAACVSSGPYDRSFFERLRGGAARSAQVILPLVFERFAARSVVDVGCGDGTWLSVVRNLGIEDVLGLDGDYVQPATLQIPRDRFRAQDLNRPFELPRTFDLAISLEVAEHLPEASGPGFIESLTRLAPVVLFSAAIPFQGGDNHINEQWPDLWAALFARHRFLPVDFIRKRIWRNEAVDWWYAQNVMLFVRKDFLDSQERLKLEFEGTFPEQLCLVHPKRYLEIAWTAQENTQAQISGVKTASRLLLACLKNAVKKRLDFLSRRALP
jgi:SAM-dependent methyltransferase